MSIWSADGGPAPGWSADGWALWSADGFFEGLEPDSNWLIAMPRRCFAAALIAPLQVSALPARNFCVSYVPDWTVATCAPVRGVTWMHTP